MALSRAYHHYDTFCEELAKAYPAFGHALWEPNPGEYPPVEVGDVGFIRQGKFHRLFNALYSKDHPPDQGFGVPEDHEQLQPIPNHIDSGALNPNTFYSYGVSVVSVFQLNGSAEVSFSCTKKQGAVLTLLVTALREDTLTKDHFREWIIMHIDSWFAFTQKLRLGIGMGDIILVTGYHRTGSWSNITFNEIQADAQFSLGVEVAGAFGASVNWRASSLRIQGAVPNHGPSGENLPESQCIFIRGFRIKRTFLGKMPRIRAAAEPKPDPRDPGSDPEPEEEVVSIPSVTERAPHCDMALVHDDDLERILGVGDGASLDFFKPDVVTDYLKRSKLEIIESKPLNALAQKCLSMTKTMQHELLFDMDPVPDDSWEQILGADDRTSLEPPQPDAIMDSLSREPDVGASPDVMDWGCALRFTQPTPSHIRFLVPQPSNSGNRYGAHVCSDASPAAQKCYPCQVCGKRFQMLQDLKRHEVQQHNSPRQCPFCLYQWKRPDKIKARLVEVHRDVLSAEILDQIRARRGKDLVEFLNTDKHLLGRELEAMITKLVTPTIQTVQRLVERMETLEKGIIVPTKPPAPADPLSWDRGR
ncbi:hypothetical protein EDB87DRAFT_1573806 [Lactarius vividus]|nr:hypothetical protein EDB87DRAFT_1573806 [Lactarius vividus]